MRSDRGSDKIVDKVLFSSDSNEWETPQWLFDLLDNEFNFKLDVCASKDNKKCNAYYSKKDNALLYPWSKDYFCNLPYNLIKEFIKRGYNECKQWKAIGVFLIPSRTDTKYWHEYVMKSREIRFIKGRLKFVGAKSSAPFPSCVVIFDGYDYNPIISALVKP